MVWLLVSFAGSAVPRMAIGTWFRFFDRPAGVEDSSGKPAACRPTKARVPMLQ